MSYAPARCVAHSAASTSILRQHSHLVYVDHAVGIHRPGHLYVMAFMSLDRVGIVNAHDFLGLVSHQHRLFAGVNALLSAGRVDSISTLSAALGIAHPAVPAHVFRGRQHGHTNEIEPNHQQHSFCHRRSLPLIGRRAGVAEFIETVGRTEKPGGLTDAALWSANPPNALL